MPSEAARALRAIVNATDVMGKQQSARIKQALSDIEAEDAKRAAQADTPEAHEAKEQWVKTIVAEVLRQVADVWESPVEVDTTSGGAVFRAVADKLDPPGMKDKLVVDPSVPEGEVHFVNPDGHVVGRITGVQGECARIIGSEPCSVCGGRKIIGQPCSCEKWPLGPGDKMQFGTSWVSGTIAYVISARQWIDTRGWSQDSDMWHRVALAEIKPGMAVEYYDDHDEVRPIYALVVHSAPHPRAYPEPKQYTLILSTGSQIGADRGDLRLLKAPAEGKA